MKLAHLICWLLFFSTLFSCREEQDKDQQINTFVDHFLTLNSDSVLFPGATVPFGLIQLQPNTLTPKQNGQAGYLYNDSIFTSFAHTHFNINNVAYQDILLMPTCQVLKESDNFQTFIPRTYSSFKHKNEHIEPGYYQVDLDNGIKIELTATQRAGIYFFHFPDSCTNALLLDLTTGQTKDTCQEAQIKKIDSRTIVGSRKVKKGSQQRQIFYKMEFSQDVNILVGNQSADSLHNGEKRIMSNLYAWIDFSKKTNQVMAKIGISSANIEGASVNLEKEISHWSFDKVKRDAKQTWKKELSKISVSNNNDAKKIFYTSLYQLYTKPMIYSDINGNFSCINNIHSKTKNVQYTNWNLEEMYSSIFSLYTLTQRTLITDFISSLTSFYDFCEYVPLWEVCGNESQEYGYPAISIFTEAWQKGFVANKENMYEMLQRQVLLKNQSAQAFDSLGYVPAQYERSTQVTLEYTFWNWCLSEWARCNDNAADYDTFISASEYYRNIFNSKTATFQEKTAENVWKDKNLAYVSYAPHAIAELVELCGGKENFSDVLHRYQFLNPQNRQALSCLYLYNYTHHAKRSYQLIDSLRNQFYTQPQSTFAHFEKCDAPSWFIFSAMGFYPLNPANGIYQLGTPLFSNISIKIGPEKYFNIKANRENEQYIYVKKVLLNGKRLSRNYLTYKEITSGGDLEFILSDQAE